MPDFASTMMSAPGTSRPAARQRQQRQQRGGRVAARVRQQPRGPDGVHLELGQAVGHAVGQVASGRIPLRARGRVAQAERAGEIDDAHAAGEQLGRELRRGRLGQRQENDVGLRATRAATSSGTTSPSQMRARPGRRRGVLVACDAVASVSDGVGMAGEQPDELLTGVAGRARNAGTDRGVRPRCVLIPVRSFTPSLPRRKTMRQKEYLYKLAAVAVNAATLVELARRQMYTDS